MYSWSFVSGYPLWGHLGYYYFWTMPTWKPLFFCIWHVDSLGHAGLPSYCWWVWPLSQRAPFFQGLWRMPCCSTGRSLIFRAGRDEGWSFAQPGVQNQNCGWRFCRKKPPFGGFAIFSSDSVPDVGHGHATLLQALECTHIQKTSPTPIPSAGTWSNAPRPMLHFAREGLWFHPF